MSVSPSLSRRLRRVSTTSKYKNILRQLGCNPESPSWPTTPISRQTFLDMAGPQFRCKPIVIESQELTEARAAIQEIEDSFRFLHIASDVHCLSGPLYSSLEDISKIEEHSEDEQLDVSGMCARLASLLSPHVPARSKFWKHARRVASSVDCFLLANGREPICFQCLTELDQPVPTECLYTHRFCGSCKKLGLWGVDLVSSD
jgi:hypothetical protein